MQGEAKQKEPEMCLCHCEDCPFGSGHAAVCNSAGCIPSRECPVQDREKALRKRKAEAAENLIQAIFEDVVPRPVEACSRCGRWDTHSRQDGQKWKRIKNEAFCPGQEDDALCKTPGKEERFANIEATLAAAVRDDLVDSVFKCVKCDTWKLERQANDQKCKSCSE